MILTEAILQLNGGNLGPVSLLCAYWLALLLGSPKCCWDKVLSYGSIYVFHILLYSVYWRSWRCIGFALSALVYIAVCFYTAYSVFYQRAALLMQAALTISKRHCLSFLVCLSGLELRQKFYDYLIPLEKIPLLYFEEWWKGTNVCTARVTFQASVLLLQACVIQNDLQAIPCVSPWVFLAALDIL